MGSLCLIDTRPRTLAPREMDLLELVAGTVMSLAEARVLRRKLDNVSGELREKLELLDRERRFARQARDRLLPPETVEGGAYRILRLTEAHPEMGGDFLDVHRRADGRVALFLADAMSRGPGAATLLAVATSAFRERAASAELSSEILRSVEERIAPLCESGRRMAALAVLYAPGEGALEMTSAGYPAPWLVAESDVEPVELDAGSPLPREDGEEFAAPRTLHLAEGARVVFPSDGAIELVTRDGKTLGRKTFERLLASCRQGSNGELIHALRDEILALEPVLEDDLSLLLLERSPATSASSSSAPDEATRLGEIAARPGIDAERPPSRT